MWTKRRVIDEATDPRALPEMLVKTLENLDGDALVLALGETPIFASAGIERLGILRDGRIDSPELLATLSTQVASIFHVDQSVKVFMN